MADVFDNSDEKKKQIASIAETSQKAILSQPLPNGIYRYLPNDSQIIDYVADVYAILFTSNNRVCFLEKQLANGGKQWILKGNGNYKLSENKQRSKRNFGILQQSTSGVPTPPGNQTWAWSLDYIKNNYSFESTYTTRYDSVVNATKGSATYGIHGNNMATKEFYKSTNKITDDFKIGYFEEYLYDNSALKFVNFPPNCGTVAKDFSIFNFTSSKQMYNKSVNLGFITLQKKPTEEASQNVLSPNQVYMDEDIPAYGYQLFFNILVTSDEQQALDYINNGTIPDDARIYDSDGNKVSLIEDDGKESDGSKKDAWINTEENTHPTQSQLSAGTNYFYKMTTAELTTFIRWFWNDVDLSDIIFNAVTGLYNNMAECVLTMKYYPLKPTNSDFFHLSDNSIILGRFATNEKYKKISSCAGNGKICTFDIAGNIEKYKLYSSKSRPHAFTDYSPYTDLYVYLPFYGYHKLDTNMCMERKIDITYSLDITTGALDYNIKISGTTVDTLSCNFGIDVPYTLSSMMELGSNVAKSVVDVALSAGTSIATNFQSSVIPAEDSKEKDVPKSSKGGSNLVGNSFAPPSLNINGKISNGIGLYHCLKPFLIIKHPRYYRASNYGKIEGFPCMKAYKLSTLKGYTECERPQIQKFNTGIPTADEIGEILNILSNGIVIR